MGKIEILAPVGGREQLLAAVRCGADAVYLGARGFTARRNAENFDGVGLKEAVSYCRARGVTVHVTVNTLVMDSEMEALEAEIAEIAQSGADAAIIQDMAVMSLFRDCCPSVKRHASTQAVVHNTDGAKLMEELGFDRVVLARELSLKEIEKISSSVNIETEVFVHGAHCMSVSGACYLSAMLGGRSGNRGLCAQPCRLDFSSGGRSFALSLKDMCNIPHIKELMEAGVSSLKIEGRMKRPEYVAAAVTACKSASLGEGYELDSLRAVFSRSGFTDGYLTARRTMDMFGYRRKEDVEAASGVLGKLASLYRAERKSVPVSLAFRAVAGKPALLTASDGEISVTAEGVVPQPAVSRAIDRYFVNKNLSKTGGTPFNIEALDFSADEGLSLSAAEINALRRDCLDALLKKRGQTVPHTFAPPAKRAAVPYSPSAPALWGRFETPAQVCLEAELEKIILPLEELDRSPGLIAKYGERLIGELPALCFPDNEDRIRAMAASAKKAGLRTLICGNAYGIALAKSLDMDIFGGFGLNIMNTRAIGEYEAMGLKALTLSIELSMDNIRRLGGSVRRGLVAYGYLPLMKMRSCPARGRDGCSNCAGSSYLTDRLGKRFRVLCHEKRWSSLLNSVPLHIADKTIGGADFLTLYFTCESAAECEKIISDYIKKAPASGERTGGLYYRSLQ